jgi:xylulose-5-phosphate/fructose-6-phosphate phosphoketolase
MDAAVVHCTEGIGIWPWASNDQGGEPDVVMACCGDTPTLEILAAVSILRTHLPDLKIRVINVVDLMKVQPSSEHPHGLSDRDYDSLFTKDRHIIFGFHGYPWRSSPAARACSRWTRATAPATSALPRGAS